MNKRYLDNIFVKSEIIFVIFLWMALFSFSVETADAQIKSNRHYIQHSIKKQFIRQRLGYPDFVLTDPMFGAKS